MPMWLCAWRADCSAIAASTPSRATSIAAISAMGGTPSEHCERAIEWWESRPLRSVHTGSRSSALPGSSSALSSTFEVRSAIRSESSIMMIRHDDATGERYDVSTQFANLVDGN